VSDRPPPPPTGLAGVAPRAVSRFFRRLATLALVSPLLLAVVELVARPWSHDAWLPIWRTSLLVAPVVALAFGLVGAIAGKLRPSRRGTLRVDGDHLVLDREDGVRHIPLSSLRSGLVVPGIGGRSARVEIDIASGDQLFADVPAVAEGEQLLAAAGVDVSRRRSTIPLRSIARGVLRRGGAVVVTVLGMLVALGFLIGAIGPIPSAFIPVWLFTTAALAWLAAHVTRSKSITVGADGLVIPGALRDRFVSFAEVAAVRAERSRVHVELRDRSVSFAADEAAARAVALRVEEAMAARADGPAAEARLGRLARGGRTVAEWREAAARAARSAGDYRAAGFSEDDLAALLGSSEAAAEHRLGAALALAARGDAQRERVRIAADACAGPKMRVALSAIAAGEASEEAV
jgi:hypothetical protein